MDIYYVYGLIDPATGECFYVGNGKNNRMFSHVAAVKCGKAPNNNRHLFNKIRNILDTGTDPGYSIYGQQLSEDAAFTLEEVTIAAIGIDKLCNLWSSGRLGRTPSPEVLAKKSAKLKGRKTKPRSEETKQKIRNSLLGRKKGPLSDDTKMKISEATSGKPKQITEEERDRRRQQLDVTRNQDGYNQRLSDAKIGHVVSEETRKKIGDAHRGKTISEEHRQKIRESNSSRKRNS